MTWYCIRTMRRAELSLVEELRELGLFAYVPCEKHTRKIRRKKVAVTVPAFAGYAFVNCEPAQHAVIRACDGFWRFVTYVGSEEPARMSAAALQSVFLADVFGDMDHTRVPEAYAPARGDAVVVKSGLWRGKLALIVSVGKRKSLLQPIEGFGRWEVKNGDLELAA